MLGGIQRYLYDIYSHFPPAEVAVLAPWIEGCDAFDRAQPFCIYRRDFSLGTRFYKLRWLPLWMSIFHVWRWERPDVIHCSQPLPMGLATLSLKTLAGGPYLTYVHGNDVIYPQLSSLSRQALYRVLVGASRVITNSVFTREYVLRLGVAADQVAVIHPPVEMARLAVYEQPSAAAKLASQRIILSVGRLVTYKGYDVVIQALPQVLARVPEAHYVIVGEGPDQRRLEVMADGLGVRHRVTFAGRVSDRELAGWYHICEVFVMLSRPELTIGNVEGFGIVYLEANACGKPVVAGRSGGISDAVMDGVTGRLVDPLDVDQAAEVIIELLMDRALAARLGSQGQERVQAEFDPRQAAEQVHSLSAVLAHP